MNVSVVDERSEIAACFEGIAQCDLGPRADVMDGCPKAEGMLMMLRSMAPDVMAVDEAGVIMAMLPNSVTDEYIAYIEKAMGEGSAYRMSIRPYGAVCVDGYIA